jgi:hypothetical protein
LIQTHEIRDADTHYQYSETPAVEPFSGTARTPVSTFQVMQLPSPIIPGMLVSIGVVIFTIFFVPTSDNPTRLTSYIGFSDGSNTALNNVLSYISTIQINLLSVVSVAFYGHWPWYLLNTQHASISILDAARGDARYAIQNLSRFKFDTISFMNSLVLATVALNAIGGLLMQQTIAPSTTVWDLYSTSDYIMVRNKPENYSLADIRRDWVSDDLLQPNGFTSNAVQFTRPSLNDISQIVYASNSSLEVKIVNEPAPLILCGPKSTECRLPNYVNPVSYRLSCTRGINETLGGDVFAVFRPTFDSGFPPYLNNPIRWRALKLNTTYQCEALIGRETGTQTNKEFQPDPSSFRQYTRTAFLDSSGEVSTTAEFYLPAALFYLYLQELTGGRGELSYGACQGVNANFACSPASLSSFINSANLTRGYDAVEFEMNYFLQRLSRRILSGFPEVRQMCSGCNKRKFTYAHKSVYLIVGLVNGLILFMGCASIYFDSRFPHVVNDSTTLCSAILDNEFDKENEMRFDNMKLVK